MRKTLGKEVAAHSYKLFGITFSCDASLLLPLGDASAEPRFNLRAANSEANDFTADETVRAEGDQWIQIRLLSSGALEVEWEDWLILRASADGRTIVYRVHEDAYPEAFEAHIANFAASIALILQGEESLHSTALWIDGQGIGLLGASGAGKSTFAAYLLNQGAQLLTDDLLRISESEGRLYAEPGPPRLKLFGHSAERHFSHHSSCGKWSPLSQKYLFQTGDPNTAQVRRPLDSLVWLAPPDANSPDAISIGRLRGLELFKVIAGSTMNPRIDPPGRQMQQFVFAQWVAKALPVYALRYPRREDIFPELLSLLREEVF